MIKTRTSFFLAALLFLFLLAWISAPYCPAQQNAEHAVTTDPQEKDVPEKIVSGPQDIKQKTGIWVFFAWLWVSVIVIIYFLRLKIKEVDRLHELRFYSAKKN